MVQLIERILYLHINLPYPCHAILFTIYFMHWITIKLSNTQNLQQIVLILYFNITHSNMTEIIKSNRSLNINNSTIYYNSFQLLCVIHIDYFNTINTSIIFLVVYVHSRPTTSNLGGAIRSKLTTFSISVYTLKTHCMWK